MKIMSFRIGALFLAVLITAGLLIVSLAGCGGGTQADKMSIDEVWSRAGDTKKTVTSEHMEIAIYYENTTYGSGQTGSLIFDVNGEDSHLQNLVFGNVVSEDIMVGGKHYRRDAGKSWAEVSGAPSDNSTQELTSRFLELPSLAASQERVGKETLDGLETEHYHFGLDPEGAISMFPSTPPADFSATSGGDFDVWITTSDFNMVRYELIIRNVKITNEIGNGDLRFTVNVRDINKPIEIDAPM